MKVFVYIILKREKESIMDKFFKISERGSTIKTEIMAGLTTFFAMAYIVLVNPNQVAAEGSKGWLAELVPDMAGELGTIWNSVFIASILHRPVEWDLTHFSVLFL